MKMSSRYFAVLLASATLTTALTTVYPEVIPGPGLPSLKELGLTSKDLYTKPLALSSHEGSERVQIRQSYASEFDGFCERNSGGGVDNVIACFNYLVAFGSGELPTIWGETVVHCTAGDAQVTSTASRADIRVQSTGSNAALGLQWIFSNCNKGGRVGGYQAAVDNPAFIVGASSSTFIF